MSENHEITKAICSIMAMLGTVAKANKNEFDNYKFASIDDFLSQTSKACAEFGIVIIQEQESFETISKQNSKGYETTWLMMSFVYDVLHDSGERLPRSQPRTVALPMTGPQSFGSAAAYSFKQFSRMLFQISCGDGEDADFTAPTNDVPEIKKPPKRISKATSAKLKTIAKDHPAFETMDIFYGWIYRIMKGVEFEQLSDASGKNILKFLGENPNAETWEDKYRVPLLEEITEHMDAAAQQAAK